MKFQKSGMIHEQKKRIKFAEMIGEGGKREI